MSFFQEFRKFALRGNIADLAIGIVIGTAFNNIITSLVNNILTPPFGLLIGNINFADLVFNLGGTVKIQYGLFLQSVVSFLITALGLFFVFRLLNRIERLARRDPPPPPPAVKSPEVIVLEEILETLKRPTSTTS